MNSDIYLKAKFERFRGTLYPENGKVEFEGMIFNNACQAIQLLKELSDEDEIKSKFMHKGLRGFELDDDRVVTINSEGHVRTFACKFTARMVINNLKKKGKL
jgi:hypothetical protein